MIEFLRFVLVRWRSTPGGASTRWIAIALSAAFIGLIGTRPAPAGSAPSERALSVHPERRGLSVMPYEAPAEASAMAAPAGASATSGGSAPLEIKWGRSLLVRDPALLSRIRFADVMHSLVRSSGGRITDRETLFAQWWNTARVNTQDPKLGCGTPETGEPPTYSTTSRGFKYECPRPEAQLADTDPFVAFDGKDPFVIIAAVNRIDLLIPPEQDPEHPDCGEYRLIAAKHPEWRPANFDGEVLISFEAVLPDDSNGECMAVQKFWASLSNPSMSGEDVAEKLRLFFLEGITLREDGTVADGDSANARLFQLKPLMSIDYLGGGASRAEKRGRIRTNSTPGGNDWVLRDYQFEEDGDSVLLLPKPTSGAIEPSLFAAAMQDSDAARTLLNRLTNPDDFKSLLDPNINVFSFVVPLQAEAEEMHSDDKERGDYSTILTRLGRDTDIWQAIENIPDMAAGKIRKRLAALSCAGCHQFSPSDGDFVDDFDHPVCWHKSLGFKHLDYKKMGDGQYGTEISDALRLVFLPNREYIMRRYLLGVPPEEKQMSQEAKDAASDPNYALGCK